jgi:hypothetical protein
MDFTIYRKYLVQFVKEAIQNSNGTNAGIAESLQERTIGKAPWVRNKEEQRRALADACKAFEEHRHWPLDLVLSHLGIDKELT